MKKAIFIIVIICLYITGCNTQYSTEITKLYSIEKYKVHENGVEIWAVSDSGEEKGFFVEHEKVYSYEEPDEKNSRVVALYTSAECEYLRNAYLYFSEYDFKEYIKERYDIE